MTAKYASKATETSDLPKGISYIVANEAAERFSFYGMKTILVIFMTKYLVDKSGANDFMSPEEAKTYFHLFGSGVYLFPLLGAFLADWLLGKYKTILWLSIVYCLGHLALAMDETRFGLALGLSLIALGSGGIKPCVSAHLGDQFGQSNSHLKEKVFSWFYLSINAGSFLSTLLTPVLLKHYGPHIAFGLPGLLMLIATALFYRGRQEFVHVPASGRKFLQETFSSSGLKILGKLAVIYTFVAMFWALYDQTASAWILQAEQMDLKLLGIEWLPSQVQAINPVLVLILTPIITYTFYPFIRSIVPFTQLNRITVGLFIAAGAFLLSALIESWIQAGQTPSIAWQLLAFLVITIAEVFVSITCIEFSYDQAPASMKSLVMALFYLSNSIGNLFVALINFVIQNEDGTSKLAGPDYYLFFAGLMAMGAFVFIWVARWYERQQRNDTDQSKSDSESVYIPAAEALEH